MDVKKENILSAREVLAKYLEGDVASIVTFKKICNAFELVDRWDPSTAQQFLEQLLSIADLVDERCKSLVHSIAKLRWSSVPVHQREAWRNLLCEIGVRHVVHLDVVLHSAVSHLLPAVVVNAETGQPSLALAESEQAALYEMAHKTIAQLIVCIPAAAKLVAKQVSRSFPHHSAASLRYTAFVRNVLCMSEYAESIRADLWSILVDNLVTIDTLIGRPSDGEDSGAEIFVLEDEEEEEGPQWEESTMELVGKLDGAMQATMQYLARTHGREVEGTEWLRLLGATPESVYLSVQAACEKHLLPTRHARFVPFLWLFLASLHESYASRTLSFLWDVLLRPSFVQGETRRSHGAASYLAAFLARAKYIDIDLAKEYLARMAAYLASYVDRVGLSSRTIVPGLAHHGVFYAMANAFFLAFAFRYREIVKSGALDEVRHWCLGRFIHSSLNPLRYSLSSVARCFAAVSRSLQLIYCNHVLPLSYDDVRRPFEPCFPFDAYSLEGTAELVAPLTRKFSPMKEDAAELSRELRGSKRDEEDEGAVDFLDDDDMEYGSVKQYGPLAAGAKLFTTYSTSPGLRPFHVGSPMDLY